MASVDLAGSGCKASSHHHLAHQTDHLGLLAPTERWPPKPVLPDYG